MVGTEKRMYVCQLQSPLQIAKKIIGFSRNLSERQKWLIAQRTPSSLWRNPGCGRLTYNVFSLLKLKAQLHFKFVGLNQTLFIDPICSHSPWILGFAHHLTKPLPTLSQSTPILFLLLKQNNKESKIFWNSDKQKLIFYKRAFRKINVNIL